MQHLRSRKDYQLDLSLQSTLMITINPQELQQILVNLIVNAIQALPERTGKVSIHSRNNKQHSVQIKITDNGHGMDDDSINKVFNPFYTTKSPGQGTGLGLSISYGLVRRYGGNIEVNSTPETGTEFIVTLLCKPVLIEDEKMIRQQLDEIENDSMVN